jgi:hypothetical protein
MDGIMESHNLLVLGFFPLIDSNPKRQPPRNDKINPAYNVESFINNTFVSKSKIEILNVAIAPRKKGNRPSVAIIFIVMGI